MNLTQRLGLSLPLIQAPMAGTSTSALAAEVCNAGALGSIAIGAVDASGARTMIADLRERTGKPFNVNVFTHGLAQSDPEREAGWLDWLRSLFVEFGAEPPAALKPAYRSFAEDPAILALLVETAPAVVSFHFGLPDAEAIAALKAKGVILMATATSLDEARAIEAAGIDAVVAQGIEAGGHRGIFDPDGTDDQLATLVLTRLLARELRVPVIAAGGIMDGAGIAAALNLGAVAAQLGTAFVGCPESAADDAYRAALASPAALHTTMTRLISGRPARALPNRFTALAHEGRAVPGYPVAYDAGKALNAAARARGEYGFGAQWAGQGAPLSRPMPAARLVELLSRELAEAMGSGAIIS